MTDNDNAW